MDPRLPEPEALEGLLERLKSLLTGSAPEALLDQALQLLARLGAASAAGLLLVDREKIASETWWTEDGTPVPDRVAIHFRNLAVESGRRGVPVMALLPPGALDGAVPGVFLQPLDQERRLVLCLATSRAARAESAERVVIASALELAALRLAEHERVVKAAAEATQYQRWFKLLDNQIRVLDRERQKFAAVVNQSDTYVFVADQEGAIRWANRAMAQRFPPEEGKSTWVGETCRSLCSRFGENLSQVGCEECPLRRAIGSGEVEHRELREIGHDAVRDLYLTALPIRDPDGGAREVLVMIQDLSDLETLRASESRYRLLFERSANAIVMADPATHRIVLANPTASRMTGYTTRELMKLTLEDFYAPADAWPRVATEGAARRSPESAECVVRMREGGERTAIVSSTRFNLGGQELQMVEFRDITERRRAERDLQKIEARLRTVISSSPIVLFAIDRDGIFTLSEGKGLEALGLKPGEMVGRSAFEVYAGTAHVVENLRRALAGEEFTEVVQQGDLTFETRHTPIRDARGRVDGMIGVATDVTLQRRLEDELRHSQKMEAIGRLAGGVAHDFNNLLTAIMGHAQLLRLRLGADDPLGPYVEEINKAGARGALLTRQLLAFGRKEVLSPRVIDLNTVVEGMESMLRRLIGEDLDLETALAQAPAWVRADRSQMEQVIMNLAVNARDAMPGGGRLTVRLENLEPGRTPGASGARVAMEVADSGCGMEAQTLAHLFEPFFTTKEHGKGTGLGMSIVYGIVQQNGGEIQVDSQPGSGTVIRILLPRAERESENAEGPARAESSSAGFETILLVEDEDAVRGAVREALTANGYTVLEARGGSEALEIAASFSSRVHLVLTDVVMPKMGGGELAQRLTALDPELRVLYVSGYADDAIVRHGVADEGAPFLQKPFSLAALARKVREVLDAPPHRSTQPRAA